MKLFAWMRKRSTGASSAAAQPPALPLPDGIRLAENLGDLWGEIGKVAREDGLLGRSAVEHYNLSSEGKRDVERWLQIYLRRIRPGSGFRLPSHYRRHRGHSLIPRVWPDGLRWQAVNDETLFCARIPEEPDQERLIDALDRHLDSAQGS